MDQPITFDTLLHHIGASSIDWDHEEGTATVYYDDQNFPTELATENFVERVTVLVRMYWPTAFLDDAVDGVLYFARRDIR